MQQSASSSSVSSAQAASNNNKPADYVYFERTTAGFSEDALPRSKAAQLKLEHFYKVAVDAAIERNTRYVRMHKIFGVCVFIDLADVSSWNAS